MAERDNIKCAERLMEVAKTFNAFILPKASELGLERDIEGIELVVNSNVEKPVLKLRYKSVCSISEKSKVKIKKVFNTVEQYFWGVTFGVQISDRNILVTVFLVYL